MGTEEGPDTTRLEDNARRGQVARPHLRDNFTTPVSLRILPLDATSSQTFCEGIIENASYIQPPLKPPQAVLERGSSLLRPPSGGLEARQALLKKM
jgi:hypothetical protein